MKNFDNFDKIKKFIAEWKEESDSILNSKDPLDIDDFEERNTYNQEIGVNNCLDVILDKIHQIENESSMVLS